MQALCNARVVPTCSTSRVTARHDGTQGVLRPCGSPRPSWRRSTRARLATSSRPGTAPSTRRPSPATARVATPPSRRAATYSPASPSPGRRATFSSSVRGVWRGSPVFERIRGLKIADYPACAPCPDKSFCSRNRGAAYNASGSYTGTDPFVCAAAGVARAVASKSTPRRRSAPRRPASAGGRRRPLSALSLSADRRQIYRLMTAMPPLGPVVEIKHTLAGGREALRLPAPLRRRGLRGPCSVVAGPMHVHGVDLPAGTVTFGHFWTDRLYNVYHWLDARSGGRSAFTSTSRTPR